MFDGSGGAADLEKLSKIPGMEGLADPEQFKAQMASYQKMMAQMQGGGGGGPPDMAGLEKMMKQMGGGAGGRGRRFK